ncbi:MAG: amylo-alpha-1,6-glucosidase [Opitutaceae bacterium]|jgi:predicted glycogen debranching enzyme
MNFPALGQEWLEADGLGGFAMGTAHGARTRRYHAWLQVATNPPAGRFVLVNGADTFVVTPAGRYALSTQCYAPEVSAPNGSDFIASFTVEPWPTWEFRLPGGLAIVQELFVPHGRPAAVLRWRFEGHGAAEARLAVRPFFSGRDPHALHHENVAFRFEPQQTAWGGWRWTPYDGVPSVAIGATGNYVHDPHWYRQFRYSEEEARGLDCVEDLASPGIFGLPLAPGREGALIFAAPGLDPALEAELAAEPAGVLAGRWAAAEWSRRAAFATPLHRAADAYLVKRDRGLTIIAGYPWFGDWGRDTFIALRGLCLATGRVEAAAKILLEWAGTVSEGMLPNFFPDRGQTPEYNSVDASLWFIVAVHDVEAALGPRLAPADRARLHAAAEAILHGYAEGTRFGIRADADGLLFAGAPGVQLTWMDAKVGDWVVTPRRGKPVEVQALWINALQCVAAWNPDWLHLAAIAEAAFDERFWNETAGCLYDVIDVDFVSGANDPTLRPNQIFAAGGLPFPLLDRERTRRIVAAVESRLLTPLGLRTLDPAHPDYRPFYRGGVRERDGAYHQGTVWPWLATAFVEAWLRAQDPADDLRKIARERFLAPLLAHLREAGLGHISEIADAEAPHTPRGCPFQAWSVGEGLRLAQLLGAHP